MGESLTQRRRVCDEGLWVVKHCRAERTFAADKAVSLTVPLKEAPANSVPAAAVIQRVRTLLGIIGRKARVGGQLSRL